MNLPGQYVQYVKESFEQDQLKYVRDAEIGLDKEKTMEKVRIYRFKDNIVSARVQLIKRDKNGRFQSYMTQNERLSLLLGILFTEVLIFLAII